MKRATSIALGLCGIWLAYTQIPPKPPILSLNKVKEDLYQITGHGGNVAVYVTAEGVILVDDKFEIDHDTIVQIVKSVTNQPIRYVVSTHYHDDHSGGNAGFIGSTEIISTAKARHNILKHKQPGVTVNLVPARITFSEECSLFLGGKEVRAVFLGRGHTDGDAVIYFPEHRTIHTGDLMAGETPNLNYTVIDYAGGGSIVAWVRTLDDVLKMDFETVIPGHGKITNKAGLLAYRDTLDKLRSRTTSMVRAGASQDDVEKMVTAEFGWKRGGQNFQFSFPGLIEELR